MSDKSHGPALLPRNVASAVIIKDEDIFLVCERDGGIPPGNQDGFGLYYHDCRYLDGHQVRIGDTEPTLLVATADKGSIAGFELTNQQLNSADRDSVAAQTVGVTLRRVIDGEQHVLHEVFTITNYDVVEHKFGFAVSLESKFEDVFVIRGMHGKKTGKPNDPEWKNGVLVLSYSGADGVRRSLEAHFDPKPENVAGSEAHFAITLGAGARKEIKVSLFIVESREQKTAANTQKSDAHSATDRIDSASQAWLAGYAEVQSDNPVLDAVAQRCLLDLRMLRSELEGCHYISAGLPWYGALFGRDSLIALLQTLPYEPYLAEETLRLLARHQGTKTDDWRDEQPGKILHELRRGELANLNEIPQTPYYGSVDSTPLFLILVGEHARWTGDLSLFRELRSNVERALDWIDTYGTDRKLGYLTYATKSKKGLGNQGWKDSGDSIMNADGSLAEPPIALVEVQGYVYRAKLVIADLYERSGNKSSAARLREEAADLKERFNADFWVDEKQFYALALQKEKKAAAVISSNPGQALWTGIVDESHAEAVVHGLTAPDMFSGWGIRTLSIEERRANPIGYHLGTVWPHDNSIIAAGFRRYGFKKEAIRVFNGILQAARNFEHYRLPEVFAGFSRDDFAVPVRYPVACHPQAWAAGSIPFMLTTLLGLIPDAFQQRLHVIDPVLPNNVSELEFRRIKVAGGSVDLRFRRKGERVDVEVLDCPKNVKVEVDATSRDKAA